MVAYSKPAFGTTMLQATVYRRKRRCAIPKRLRKLLNLEQRDYYIQEPCAVFFIRKHDDSIGEAKEAALKLIRAYMKKWNEDWTHYAVIDGNPFGDGKNITGILPITKL